jgi:hypothetical protein
MSEIGGCGRAQDLDHERDDAKTGNAMLSEVEGQAAGYEGGSRGFGGAGKANMAGNSHGWSGVAMRVSAMLRELHSESIRVDGD